MKPIGAALLLGLKSQRIEARSEQLRVAVLPSKSIKYAPSLRRGRWHLFLLGVRQRCFVSMGYACSINQHEIAKAS